VPSLLEILVAASSSGIQSHSGVVLLYPHPNLSTLVKILVNGYFDLVTVVTLD
jgi:hypothetical protein